jgi:hypothetical protein
MGKELAQRWLSLLALPGVLFLGVAVAARVLGHRHPFSVTGLADTLTGWAARPAVATVGGQVVLFSAVVIGSAAAGLAAQALGSLCERLVLAADWPGWVWPLRQLAARYTDVRHRRWAAAVAVRDAERPRQAERRALRMPARSTALDSARAVLARFGEEEPERPTWSGDRINAVAARLDRDLQVDLAEVWPCIWLILAEDVRGQVTTARQALTRAAALSGWALLYLSLTVWWWPAALLSLGLALASRSRIRSSAEDYACLLEAAVRLHACDLATRLAAAAEPPAPAGPWMPAQPPGRGAAPSTEV